MKDRINLVDIYNTTRKKEALEILLEADRTLEVQGDFILKVMGRNNSFKIFEDKGCYWEVLNDNPLGFKDGDKISPFHIYQVLEHDGYFNKAYSKLLAEFEKEHEYIRVGVDYFKIVNKKDVDGVTREALLKWSKVEIKQDCYSKIEFDIPKYEGFIMRPSNVDYQKSIGGFYNTYQRFTHVPIPCTDLEEIPWSVKMIKHVFGDQWELGLIYFQVMYLHPMQTLPILGLVSKENQTGKTTLANWILSIFGANGVILDIGVFNGVFTEEYAEKNIVVIEEAYTAKLDVMNKIKALSTQKTISNNKKHISPYSTDFFCKFIVNSNHEENFLRIDQHDIRYWIRKIPVIPQGMANHNIERDLTREIPKFIGYLAQMPAVDFSRSRMIFTEEEIRTDQLDTVKEASTDVLYQEIKGMAYEYLLENPKYEDLRFTTVQMKRIWFDRDNKVNSKWMNKVFKDMRLERPEGKQRHQLIQPHGISGIDVIHTGCPVRVWIIKRDQFADWGDDLIIESQPDTKEFYE